MAVTSGFDPRQTLTLRSAPGSLLFYSVKRSGTAGFKAEVAVVDGRGNLQRPFPYRGAIGEHAGKRSVPEILKPGQNQALYNSKDHRGRNTEHERSVRRLQRSQQPPRWCKKEITVPQRRVVDR